jgi:hypothetical protein
MQDCLSARLVSSRIFFYVGDLQIIGCIWKKEPRYLYGISVEDVHTGRHGHSENNSASHGTSDGNVEDLIIL